MGHYFVNDEGLKSEIKEFSVKIRNEKFCFKTDNGVFSKGELDFGTKILIETVLKENLEGTILDLGCGYGAIGIVFNKLKGVKTDLVDVNKRAIHLTKLNIKENECTNINCFESDGYENVKEKYNTIISNPPIRVGKEKLYQLIVDARKYLIDNGKIYLVIRREQGAKSFMQDMKQFYNIEILEKKKGFFVICLKCC